MADARDYVASETLRNGLPITVRALRPDDRERIAAAVRGLDRESIYLRLFSYRNELTDAALDRIMRFDTQSEVVLLVVTAEERVIGSGRYVASSRDSAEIAFMVEEDFHGQGVASRLLRHLAQVAIGQGVRAFEADVLAENKAMLAVFERTGWAMTKAREGDVIHVKLALTAMP